MFEELFVFLMYVWVLVLEVLVGLSFFLSGSYGVV